MHSSSSSSSSIMSLALACLAAFAVLLGPAAGKQQQQVDVYYESMCPDSIAFIREELTPAYEDLKEFLRISFVPFGKASWVIGSDGRPVFECQHGARECEGNKAQACALDEIERSFANVEEQQQKKVELVHCAMTNRNPSTAVPQCASKLGLNREAIERCISSDLGNQLLIALGEKTNAFKKPLSFVPTIVINGEHKTEAFRDFSRTVCDGIPDDEKPEVCSRF